MKLIIIILILIFLTFLLSINLNRPYKENFESPIVTLSIVDPYSIWLHEDATNREDWWHHTHSKKFYYYHNMVPFNYKE